ncbi:MAG: 8-amino-7-oxononanoate synthase [Gloeomargaritaceae cyanobacterium C42_A2020_066]|nr:8-amino-7-oxononanoate synthase [Gloeomargaritaceae cyanobacterium C42_A2020_066]
MGSDVYAWLEERLATLRRAGWQRQSLTLSGRPGPVVLAGSQRLVNFASNDYLGLAADPRLIAAATEALNCWGTGGTGSRLLSGERPVHTELEAALAQWKQTEAALVFSSGYAANVGTVAALVGQRDLVLMDAYSHASLRKGAQLSGATTLTYDHLDFTHLEKLLEHHRCTHRRGLILTDSVFSMDGDVCPLPGLLDLAERYACMVLVDEAHGTGVFGSQGAGVATSQGCGGRPLIQVGTLSKALGSQGGYVAGSQTLIDYLRHRASAWVYSTSLAPAAAAAALAGVQLAQSEPQRRQTLWDRTHHLHQQLQHTFPARLLPSASHILCLKLTNPEQALEIAPQLQAQGILAAVVRPPTVPTSRIRLSLMATHRPEHLQALMSTLQSVLPQP